MTLEEKRMCSRSKVMLEATLEWNDTSVCVNVRDVSPNGALVGGERFPEAGRSVVFKRKGLAVKGKIVWVGLEQAGLLFGRSLQRKDVFRTVPGPRPKPKFDFRRPALASRPLSTYEKMIIGTWTSDNSQ